MTKRIILFLCVSLSVIAAKAQDSTAVGAQQQMEQAASRPAVKFGYISYTEVLQMMPEYKKALADIDTVKAAYNKEVETSEAELNRRFIEYVEGQKTFPENILLKRQKEIQLLIEQSVEFKQEAQQLVKNAEKDIMEPVYDRLNEALAKVGKDRDYAFIINTDNNSCPFVNPAQGEDATNAVLAVLGVR